MARLSVDVVLELRNRFKNIDKGINYRLIAEQWAIEFGSKPDNIHSILLNFTYLESKYFPSDMQDVRMDALRGTPMINFSAEYQMAKMESELVQVCEFGCMVPEPPPDYKCLGSLELCEARREKEWQTLFNNLRREWEEDRERVKTEGWYK